MTITSLFLALIAAHLAGAVITRSEWLASSREAERAADVVVLSIDVGDGLEPARLRVRLRPELSPESAAYLRAAARAACAGQLYRNEPQFLVQGRIACDGDAARALPALAKGPCPPGAVLDPNRACFAHDPNCGCHGPIMTRGMVGWAGGGAGPEFFVYTGARPAEHWAHDHTVFGEVADDASFAALERLHALPVRDGGGMHMLLSRLPLRITEAAAVT